MQVDVARVFVFMIGGGTSGSGSVEVALYAVVANAADADITAFHEEILVTVYTVGHSLSDVECKVLYADVVATLDGMLGVACHVERAFSLKLNLSFAVDTASLRTIGSIGQCVDGAVLRTYLNALAIGNVECCTAWVGKSEPIERDCTFVGAAKSKFTIGSSSRKDVCYLVTVNIGSVTLDDCNMCSFDSC